MAYFTDDFVDFFKGLEQNNHRDWFQANRKLYESAVKNPFNRLVGDILTLLTELDPDIVMEPKEAIFRINRDIRFSRDKTPYNTMVKAGFARDGRKSPYAGYYLGISASSVHIGGGTMAGDAETLAKIRKHIAANLGAFNALVTAKAFHTTFGGILGDQAKRLPAELQPALEKTPYIANKQFYYMADHNADSLLTSDKLLPLIQARFETITPLNSFFKQALK